MNESRTTSNCFVTGMLWLARLSALAMAGLILLLAVGEGFHPTKLRLPELILFAPLFLAWLGLCVGWRWEGLGGTFIVVGIGGFYLTHFALTGFDRFPRGWAFPALAVLVVLVSAKERRCPESLASLNAKLGVRRITGKV